MSRRLFYGPSIRPPQRELRALEKRYDEIMRRLDKARVRADAADVADGSGGRASSGASDGGAEDDDDDVGPLLRKASSCRCRS